MKGEYIMCVIAYYPANVDAKKATLENCFDNNPDGAGIMYQANGKVIITKGFMTFDAFYEAFSIRFQGRWSGSSLASLLLALLMLATVTLPNLRWHWWNEVSLKNVVNAALAHNGVLSGFSPTGGIKAKYSDTMNFIKTVLHGTEEFLFTTNLKMC